MNILLRRRLYEFDVAVNALTCHSPLDFEIPVSIAIKHCMLDFDVAAIPIKEISESKFVAAVVTSRGGHIGFLEGIWPGKQEQYMGKFFAQFFSGIFMKNFTPLTYKT